MEVNLRTKDRGMALVILMVIVVVATLVGVWGLTSSRESMLRSGTYRAAINVQYGAEEGLQKGLLRIQEISDPDIQDSVFGKGLYSGPEKTLEYLLGICQPGACPGTSDAPCPSTFNAASGLNDVLQAGGNTNVVCNFMGTVLVNTQLILVRKADFDNGTYKSAVYLMNSITNDASGRRKILQGVVVVPYKGTPGTYALQDFQKPYLATTHVGG